MGAVVKREDEELRGPTELSFFGTCVQVLVPIGQLGLMDILHLMACLYSAGGCGEALWALLSYSGFHGSSQLLLGPTTMVPTDRR